MKVSSENRNFEHFDKAPIIVSILQFRFESNVKFDSEIYKKKGVMISSEYPEIKERFIQGIHFNPDKPDGATKVSLDEKKINGVQFISKDKKRLLVIEEDKFTFEMHGNYSNWDDFSNKAFKLWELFQNELGEVRLTGLSLRYINRINLPGGFHDISEYFTTYIQSSSGVHTINGFQFKYTSTEADKNLTIHVGHALEPPIEGSFPYLFDIDVIYSSEIKNDPSVIKNIFNLLRDKKNYIFNDGLTGKTKDLIR